jgi:Uma2 family endonuclease
MSTAQEQRTVSRVTGVTYDEYLRRRDDPAHARTRMAYLDGVLEIMSPEQRHEIGAHDIAAFVVAYCEAFDVEYQATRSTTFRKGTPGEPEGAGNEPDESFYLRDAAVTAAANKSKETLDLAVDPPPSLWIEVENTTSALDRLKLYARLRVPEVWRYQARDGVLWFGRLAGERYAEIPTSVALPGLTPALVLAALDRGATLPTSAWVRWLKGTWFPEHRQELEDAGAGR